MIKANVFDLERSSFVDGPGIRTTVFLKGCNLNCIWCHNPESKSSKRQLMYYKNACTGCGECYTACKNGAINKLGDIDRLKCVSCGECTKVCYNNARKICGVIKSVDEVYKEIIEDEVFYKTSGGGVTFSGGEPMLQVDFIVEVAKLCKEKGINVAIDTAGDVPFESFIKVLPYVSLILFDVKCVTEDLHVRGTGKSNARILENLKKLSDLNGFDIIIRTPIIPDFNDGEIEQNKIDDFVKNIRHVKHEKLKYHELGISKLQALK